jgi:hypothetical protein
LLSIGVFRNFAKNQFAFAGGIAAVVTALRAHPTHARVQHYGCLALMSIAYNADNRTVVAKEGGIEAVVAALNAHRSSEDVQYN